MTKKKQIDTRALRAILKGATQPGPYRVIATDSYGRDTDANGHNPDPDQLRYRVLDGDGVWVADFGQDPDNSAVYATFPPEVIGELLNEIDALRKRVKAGPRGKR